VLQLHRQSALAAVDPTTSEAIAEFLSTDVVGSSRQSTAEFMTRIQQTRPLLSDEFEISWSKDAETLGLGLEEQQYQGFPVTVVRRIKDAKLLEEHPELREGAIVTSINKAQVDGVPLKQITQLVAAARAAAASSSSSSSPEIVIRFRDPSRYFELLDSTQGKPLKLISSSYLPANARDAGAAEQVIYVERLELPPPEQRVRSAQYLDVMELQYVAQLASSTQDGQLTIVDSSAERAPPGTSAQSIYYVLGQQNGPPGFPPPPGWDLTLRGMVVGEKRRITLPYTLGYERKGDKNRKIPPFATLIYTVKLLSLT